jgi:hypothetical protein
MSRPQRIAQYIQRLAPKDLIRHDERDERPEDAPRAPAPTPNYAAWNATSFSHYVPFRSPPHG